MNKTPTQTNTLEKAKDFLTSDQGLSFSSIKLFRSDCNVAYIVQDPKLGKLLLKVLQKQNDPFKKFENKILEIVESTKKSRLLYKITKFNEPSIIKRKQMSSTCSEAITLSWIDL